MKIINRLKYFFSKEKKINLKHVHTFKNGRKLYTYNDEDLASVSSRYYRNVMSATNYLKIFSMDKVLWETSIDTLKQTIKQALSSNDTNDKVNALLDINSTLDWFKDKATNIKGTNETILEMLFCMFFLLEEEEPTGYNEELNKQKVELLNEDLKVRDFFFQYLKTNLANLIPLSQSDTTHLILQMEQLKGVMMYLNIKEL